MTWEPTEYEVNAYIYGAMDAAKSPPAADRQAFVARAGLRAAYAKLEQRLTAGDLLPPVAGEVVELRPPLMEYTAVEDIFTADALGAVGWRLHTADRQMGFILERERPDPPEQP